MKIYHQPIELIIDVPQTEAKAMAATSLQQQLKNAGIPVEKISKKRWAIFRDAVIAHPAASTSLKTYLINTHSV